MEYYENVESCKEAILVLENYIREFRALASYFKMSWDYEKQPKKPQSIAWEVRKTNPTPRVRNRASLNSPAISGKSSPSYSGTNSPCPTIDENKPVQASTASSNYNINKAKIASKEPPKSSKTEDSIQANEKKFEQMIVSMNESSPNDEAQNLLQKPKSMSLENLSNSTDINPLVVKRDSYSQTEGIEDDNLTLQEYFQKNNTTKTTTSSSSLVSEESSSVIETNDKKSEQKNATATLESICVENKEIVKSEEEKNVNLEPVENTLSSSSSSAAAIETLVTVVSAPQDLPLSQIIVKPVENAKPITNISNLKSQSKSTPIKANYSLRNQTISSKNTRIVERVARKATVNSAPIVNRTSRISNSKVIPSSSTTAVAQNPHTNQKTSSIGARSKTMIEISKMSHLISKPNALRRKESIENNTDSSSSTLKASIEKLSSRSNSKNSLADNKSLSFKMTDSKGTAGDGEWVTVKTKRRSSWASRFDQPSSYASLPALAFLNENSEDSDKEPQTAKRPQKVENSPAAKTRSALSKQNEKVKEQIKAKSSALAKSSSTPPNRVNNATETAKKKILPSSAKILPKKTVVDTGAKKAKQQQQPAAKQQNYLQQNAIKRQKSDITGLKIKSLHKEYLRNERSVPSSKERNDNCETKVDMNLQTTHFLISQTIHELYELENAKENPKFTNGNLSSCDEIEERDLESDDDTKKLVEEQESLERQIRELENSEIDLDTETDETDCEAILCDLDDNETLESCDLNSSKDLSFNDENLSLEIRYAPMLAEMTVHEREETLQTLQELVARDPGNKFIFIFN